MGAGPLKGFLITATADPAFCSIASSNWLARCLAAYQTEFRQSHSWIILPLPLPLKSVDWGHLWQTYADLRQQDQTVFFVHSGSLADGTSSRFTLADVAKDWHISVILTIPISQNSVSQAVAFCALARYSGAMISGLVLFQVKAGDPEIDLATLTKDIQDLTQVKVLGVLSIETLEAGREVDWAKVASSLDLEQLGIVSPQLVS